MAATASPVPSPLDPPPPVLSVLPPAAQHPARVYLSQLAPGSRRTMRQSLDLVADLVAPGHDALSLPWAELRYPQTAAVRAALLERYRPATVNKIVTALKGVLKECWRLGLLEAETYRRATDLKRVHYTALPQGRCLGAGEKHALFQVCAGDGTAAGARDGALLALLYGCGLRRSEVVALDREHYNAETGEVTLRAAKGYQDRTVWTPPFAAAALGRWLALRGDDRGPLFYALGAPGRRHRLSGQAIYLMCRKRAAQAGVVHLSPHDLRRSFISDLLDAGADLSTVQKIAGHASVETTASYDRRGERAKQEAAELLVDPSVASLPGQSRPELTQFVATADNRSEKSCHLR